MSKEHKRGSRETKKPKTADKAVKAGPKYLAGDVKPPMKAPAPPSTKKK